MPRIPVANQMDANDPGQGPQARANTRASQAFAQFGENIERVGFQLEAKRQEAETNDFLLKKSDEDINETEKYIAEERLKISDSKSADEYEKNVSKYLQDRQQKNIKEAPSSRAADTYLKRSTSFFTEKGLQEGNYVQRKKIDFYQGNIEQTIQNEGNSQVVSPSFERAKQKRNLVGESINSNSGILFDKQIGDELRGKALNKIADDTFSGYIVNADRPGMLAQAMQELNDESEDSLSKDLQPEQKARFLNQINSQMERISNEQATELKRSLNDMQAAATDGVGSYADIISLKKQIELNPNIKDDEKKRMLSTADASAKSLAVISTLKNTPASKWQNPDKMLSKGTFNYAEKDQMRNAIASAMNKELSRRKEDIATHYVESSPAAQNLYKRAKGGDPQAMQQFFGKVKNHSAHLEVPAENRRLLPKDMSQHIALQITAQPTTQGKVNAMAQWQQVSGKEWGQVVSDMVKDKFVEPELYVASTLSNPNTQGKILENIKNTDSIENSFKNASTISSDEIKKSVLSVDPELNTYLTSASGDAGFEDYKVGLLTSMNLEVKKRVAKGADYKDASRVVVQEFVDDNFDKKSGGASKLLIPKRGYDVDGIKAFAEKINTIEGVSQLGLLNDSGNPDTESFHRAVANHAFLERNKTFDGAFLMVEENSGKKRVLRDKSGKPMEIKYQDMPLLLNSKKSAEDDKKSKEIQKKMGDALSGRFW